MHPLFSRSCRREHFWEFHLLKFIVQILHSSVSQSVDILSEVPSFKYRFECSVLRFEFSDPCFESSIPFQHLIQLSLLLLSRLQEKKTEKLVWRRKLVRKKKTTEPNGYAGHWAQKYSAKKMLKIRGSRFRPHQLSAKEERRYADINRIARPKKKRRRR